MNAFRGTCSATGKVSYADRKSAKAVLAARHYHDVSVFKCLECAWFHLGGWHDVKSRIEHRQMHGEQASHQDMPISHAASFLRVSEAIVHRMIAESRVRGTHTHANHTDIQRIHTQILRQV